MGVEGIVARFVLEGRYVCMESGVRDAKCAEVPSSVNTDPCASIATFVDVCVCMESDFIVVKTVTRECVACQFLVDMFAMPHLGTKGHWIGIRPDTTIPITLQR